MERKGCVADLIGAFLRGAFLALFVFLLIVLVARSCS